MVLTHNQPSAIINQKSKIQTPDPTTIHDRHQSPPPTAPPRFVRGPHSAVAHNRPHPPPNHIGPLALAASRPGRSAARLDRCVAGPAKIAPIPENKGPAS